MHQWAQHINLYMQHLNRVSVVQLRIVGTEM